MTGKNAKYFPNISLSNEVQGVEAVYVPMKFMEVGILILFIFFHIQLSWIWTHNKRRDMLSYVHSTWVFSPHPLLWPMILLFFFIFSDLSQHDVVAMQMRCTFIQCNVWFLVFCDFLCLSVIEFQIGKCIILNNSSNLRSIWIKLNLQYYHLYQPNSF